MIKSKKILSLLLTLCMVFALLLTACSSNTPVDTATPAPATSAPNGDSAGEESPQQVTLEPVTLKWVMGGPGKQQDSDKVWTEWNQKLQADYLPNTTVEIEVIPFNEYKSRWDLMMAAGEQVDIAWTGWMIPFSEEVSKGAYLPLDDLIDTYAPDIRNEIPEWILSLGGVDGVTYSIPNFQQMTELRLGMRTHKELAENYWDVEAAEKVFYESVTSGQFRKATPEFYAEIESYLEALKEAGELRMGFSTHIIGTVNDAIFLPGNTRIRMPNRGEEWDLTVRPYYELEEIKLYHDVLHDWFKKGYIRQDYLSLDNPREDEGKEDGYVAFFHSHFNGEAERETMRFGYDIEVVSMEPDYYISRLDSPTSVTIPRTSIAPERAIQVIELMHVDKGVELYNMMVWGIEGEHYEKLSDNRVKTLQYDGSQAGAQDPYGLPKWAIGNTFKLWLNQADPEGWNEHIEEVHDNAIVAPYIGFKPNTDPINNELAQISAAHGQYNNLWAYPNYEELWVQMVADLKAAGIEKVAAEMQRQLDEYMNR